MTCMKSILLLYLAMGMVSGGVETRTALYQRALRLSQNKQYQKATPLWKRLNTLFAKAQTRQKRASRSWYQLRLGQCHVLLHLAESQWQTGTRKASCQTRQRLETMRKSIPQKWFRFVASSSFPKQLDASRVKLEGICQRLKGTGTSAKRRVPPVARRVVPRRAVPRRAAPPRVVPRRAVPRRVMPRRVIARRVVPRVALVRRVVPPPKKASAPFYQTWWFWTVTGTVVAGGAVVVWAVVQNQSNDAAFVHRPNDAVRLPTSP
jgi:hypothetical protein